MGGALDGKVLPHSGGVLQSRAMAQAVPHHPLSAEAGLNPCPFHVRSVSSGRQWQWDRFLSEYFSFFLVTLIPPMSHSNLHRNNALYQKDKRAKLGNLQTKNAL